MGWGAEPRPVVGVDAGHENIIQVYDIMTVPPETVDFRDVYIVTNLMVGARCHRLTRCSHSSTPPPACSLSGTDSAVPPFAVIHRGAEG